MGVSPHIVHLLSQKKITVPIRGSLLHLSIWYNNRLWRNIFCLIGFSGEDPNFLNWIGWVRDNLGESTPPIYLCGLLNLSEPKKQVLRNKKIITVDLSPIFPREQLTNSGIRHKKALEWFLLSLMNGKPQNVMNWPIPSSQTTWQKSEDLPALIPGLPSLSSPGEISLPKHLI